MVRNRFAKKRKARLWHMVRIAGIVMAALAGIGIAGVIALFAYVARDLPSPEKFADRQVAESTKIFDRTGTVLLYDIHGEERRTIVGAEEISEYVKKAALAIEDANFYNHIGIEPKAILRAAYANLRGRSIRQGGSTITQQLVLNTLISRYSKQGARTIFRKVQDMILAIELERTYSKDEILTLYLNQIPYGTGAYGIEAASQTYFAKPARDLTVSQAATLAALPKAPSYYSPYGSHREELLKRKDFVLERMRSLGFISNEAYDEARQERIEFAPNRQAIKAPHFTFHVRELLEQLYGQRYLEEGGLRIITSLDWDLQQKAEELVKTYALKNEKQFKAENAALVAITPQNGDVLAMVGSRNYFDENIDGNVNVATRLRQPGSSFKPFAYATAFTKGFTPNTVLFDLEINFAVEGAEPYTPKNYDGKFRGPVTMRTALAQSLNVPSVKVLYLAGMEDTIRTAEALGITSLKDRSRYGLSLVLGGGEVTLLEETAAYAAFASDGLFHATRPILAIQDVSGRVLREYPAEERQAVLPEVARHITNILSDNAARTPVFGEASALYLGSEIPVAAKTGTTQDARDAWVLGYTTGIAAGVWVGNNDNSPMSEKGAGISAAGPLWNEFMKAASRTYAAQPFTPPQPITGGKPVLNGKLGGETIVPIDRLTGKRATEFTPRSLIERRPYTQVHTILHFINKNNPLGPEPQNPEQDSQYWNWEHAVSQWVLTENANGAHYNESPPQEYDDAHTASSLPRILLQSPYGGQILKSRTVNLRADIVAPLPIKRVEFYFDTLFVGSDFTPPYGYTYILPAKVIGEAHTFTARAYDAIENTTSDSRAVSIDSSSGVIVESVDSFVSIEEETTTSDSLPLP